MTSRTSPKSRRLLARLYDQEGPPRGWFFRVREVSAGHYVAEGEDTSGRTVRRDGADPEAVLRRVAEDAGEITT